MPHAPAAPHEEPAFRLYKGNSPFGGQSCFADYLNQRLRGNLPLEEPWLDASRALDALISASSLGQRKTLYRAAIDSFVQPYIVGNEIIYPAYMSTATDEAAIQRHYATAFRDIPAALLVIDCPPDLPALDMETDHAFGGHEQEVLLPRGAKFELLGVTEEKSPSAIAAVVSPIYAKAYTSLKTYSLKYTR